jgi:hypothetical protein
VGTLSGASDFRAGRGAGSPTASLVGIGLGLPATSLRSFLSMRPSIWVDEENGNTLSGSPWCSTVSSMLKGNFPYWLTTAPGFSFQGDAWGFSPVDADDKIGMTEGTIDTSGAKREYSQLLHLHTRLLSQLREIHGHLIAPGTLEILAVIRRRTGADPDAALSEITTAVE